MKEMRKTSLQLRQPRIMQVVTGAIISGVAGIFCAAAPADVVIDMPPPVPPTAIENESDAQNAETSEEANPTSETVAVVVTTDGSTSVAGTRNSQERVDRLERMRELLDRPKLGRTALSQYRRGRMAPEYTYGGYSDRFRHHFAHSHSYIWPSNFNPFLGHCGLHSSSFGFHFPSFKTHRPSRPGKPSKPFMPGAGHHHSGIGHNH